MKTVILLLMYAISFNANASTTVASVSYTIGIDGGTDTLLPGSDWRLEIAPTYTSTCADIDPVLSFYQTTLIPVISYIDEALDCSIATHDGFETETYITWSDIGYEQRPEFGVEPLVCPIYGDCEMNRVVNTQNKYHSTLPLDNGEHGTSNGAAKIFITKLNSSVITSIPGIGGDGGRNDLDAVTPVDRYCVKVQDAVTVDATTNSSKTPYATVHAYTWLPLEIGAGGANGTDAPTGKRVEIYEGLSPTTLYRLKEDYLQ